MSSEDEKFSYIVDFDSKKSDIDQKTPEIGTFFVRYRNISVARPAPAEPLP